MKNRQNLNTPLFLQRLALILFAVFPIALSIIAQTISIIRSQSVTQIIQFGFLVILLFLPLVLLFRNNSFWKQIEAYRILPALWVVGIAVIVRTILLQVISTNFVSDMEDTYFLAVDLYSGSPLANVDQYPNIPNSTYLNMSAFVLSVVFRLLGASPSTAKLFMVAVGGITTYLIYITGREISSKKVGLLAAFLFASLPSIVLYTGVLTGDYIAYPFIVSAVFVLAREIKIKDNRFYRSMVNYALIGTLIGFSNWFRPFGLILLIACILTIVLRGILIKASVLPIFSLIVLIFSYSIINNAAIVASNHIFETNTLSASQRTGYYVLVGLNPLSGGVVTLEDMKIVNETYKLFGEDVTGANVSLIKLAFSRLDLSNTVKLFVEKFYLIWFSHDALFDYSLAGSNDHELVNILRNIESIFWLLINCLITVNVLFSLKMDKLSAVFMMQMFIFGFAFLMLIFEVQNRYVAITIPFFTLLGALGMNSLFHPETNYSKSQI